jgi:NO-binding membrane sensor protein with MHYT domain/nitrogen-specific signal transduction histidine kinase
VQATYNSWLVALSIVVAMLVAYTALKLAARVAEAGREGGGLPWLLGGAVSMGIGIWSMHFIGMLAFSVSTLLRYSIGKTLASLVIAIITSGLALAIASRSQLSLRRLTLGAIAMGAGISAMHYSGMAAITIVPMIRYEPWLVAASIGIAVAASFAALWLAFHLRRDDSKYISLARAAAAVVMGLAISGMHYTAMAASKFAPGSYCLGGAAIENDWLAVTIGLVALGMLGLTLVTTIYDAHLGSQIRKDALRLARVNADLEHGRNLLALATRAAGISFWELDIAKRTMSWMENEIASLKAAGVDSQRSPDSIMTMTHPDDATVLFDAVRDAVARGKDVCSFRFRIVTPVGTTVHLEAHVRIFCDESGEPVRALGVSWDVTDEVQQQERQRQLQLQLREASREAGKAEVATGVLHSVGNVLNSLSVSASMVKSKLHESRVANVQRIASMLEEQGDRLADYFASDAKARQIPPYLAQLGEHLMSENQALQTEAEAIAAHVGHIRTIVAAQQTHARRGGVTEEVDIAELVDNAVAIHFAATPEVTIKREYESLPRVILDRHKLLQILGNLLSNARHALKDLGADSRLLTLRVHGRASGWFVVEVQDTGAGIAPEALKRIFEFGFTTKKDGHGFGLHSSAILAKEMGGHLAGFSDGPGRGAQFALRLPLTNAMRISMEAAG